MTDPSVAPPQDTELPPMGGGIAPAPLPDDSHIDATPVIPKGVGEMVSAIQGDIAQLGELADEWGKSDTVHGKAMVRAFRHSAHDMAIALAELRRDHLIRLRDRMGNLGRYARVRDLPQEGAANG